ncbi:MAG: type III-B CRISPR module-associated protein Cmr5 [Pseudomonadota bacterium]|nr:type III-B CRISPR module-associated protein Cmr5 [Pseudomonadota bacterium]
MQQQRAAFALKKVQDVGDDKNVDNGEFRAYASGLPAMVRMSGLGQAMAFCLTKGAAYQRLYSILSEWLTKEGQPYHGHQNLMEGITGEDMHRYRAAQAEALALLDWIKKFAVAYLRDETAKEARPS